MKTPETESDMRPRYECKTCGTKWYGAKLVPVWGKRGDRCDGKMEKVQGPAAAAPGKPE